MSCLFQSEVGYYCAKLFLVCDLQQNDRFSYRISTVQKDCEQVHSKSRGVISGVLQTYRLHAK